MRQTLQKWVLLFIQNISPFLIGLNLRLIAFTVQIWRIFQLLDDWRQSSNNGKIIGRLTSRNSGFGTAEPENAKMADCRCEKLNEVGIEW